MVILKSLFGQLGRSKKNEQQAATRGIKGKFYVQ